MSNTTKEMTKGKPLSLIIMFAVPVMISNVFQQLYTVADTAIVSRGVGMTALSAIGATDWLNYIMLGAVQGLSQGFTVIVSQKYGASDQKGLRKSVAMIIWCAVMCTVVITVCSLLFLNPVLHVINVPKEALSMARVYSRLYYLGAFATMLYNTQAAILRAIGDSRTPLIAIIISSIINIILDVWFVMGLNFGIAGAAVATMIAQVISSLYCFHILRRQKFLLPEKNEWKPDFRLIRKIMGISFPIVMEIVVISVGGIIVQSVVNTYGTAYVAGFTATNKTYGVLTIVSSSLGAAVATFTGQNFGAGKIDRIKTGVKQSVIISIIFALLLTAVLFAFGRNVIEIFIPEDSKSTEKAIGYGVYYIRIFASFMSVMYLSAVARYALQGLGRTKAILASGVVGFLTRAGVALYLPPYYGKTILFYDEIAGWICEGAILIAAYFIWHLKISENQKMIRC